MLTGIILGFVAGQIVGVVAAAFLFVSRERGERWDTDPIPLEPHRGRSMRFVLSKRGLRRSSGRSRVVA